MLLYKGRAFRGCRWWGLHLRGEHALGNVEAAGFEQGAQDAPERARLHFGDHRGRGPVVQVRQDVALQFQVQ